MFGQTQETVFTRQTAMGMRDQPVQATAAVVPAWTRWAPIAGAGVVGLIMWAMLRG